MNRVANPLRREEAAAAPGAADEVAAAVAERLRSIDAALEANIILLFIMVYGRSAWSAASSN